MAIQTAGEYAIIIHYYQPYHATIETETAVRSDRTQLGKVNFKYCPNTSGCRTVVENSDGGKMFTLGNKVTFSFKVPEDKKLWIVSKAIHLSSNSQLIFNKMNIPDNLSTVLFSLRNQ